MAIGALAYAMATAVDVGLTRGWAEWARALWALSLVGLAIAAVFTALNGMGILTDSTLEQSAYSAEERIPTLFMFIATYVGFLGFSIAGAFVFEAQLGWEGERGLFVVSGFLFLVASLGKPWWFYGTLRRLGGFSVIESDPAVRLLLAGLGALLFFLGLYVTG